MSDTTETPSGSQTTTAARFGVGDQVEVHTVSFAGEGTIEEISSTKGGGTKLYPAFRVVFHDEEFGSQGLWLNGRSLTKIR